MRNLLDETISMLGEYGKNPKDVKWVGSNDLWFSWDDFVILANYEYYNGYGGQEVASDLMVVGDSWWLERGEYDGSEWWNFKTFPKKPSDNIVPKRVIRSGYEDKLLEMTKDSED